MKFIDRYRLKRLLKLRKEMKHYEEQLAWCREIKNESNKEDVEDLMDSLCELLAITNMEAVELRSKLDKSKGIIMGGGE